MICGKRRLGRRKVLGLWTGASLLGMPETVTPMALLVIGHPAEHPVPQNRYRPDRVHHDVW